MANPEQFLMPPKLEKWPTEEELRARQVAFRKHFNEDMKLNKPRYASGQTLKIILGPRNGIRI